MKAEQVLGACPRPEMSGQARQAPGFGDKATGLKKFRRRHRWAMSSDRRAIPWRHVGSTPMSTKLVRGNLVCGEAAGRGGEAMWLS